MESLILKYNESLIDLCRRYHVFRLEVFGSAATSEFNQAKSDIDLLVEFDSSVSNRRFDNYFEFLDELKLLFGRNVDLIEPGGLKNPYLIRRINETRRQIYVAP